MPPLSTASRLAFRATDEDIKCLESIAQTLRQTRKPFANRSDALRACLKVAASDPTAVIAAAK